jgi:hypothetical protein
VFYSEAIWHYSGKFGIEDVRRPALAKLLPEDSEPEPRFQQWDHRLRQKVGSSKWPPGYWAWLVALLAFALADLVACIWA